MDERIDEYGFGFEDWLYDEDKRYERLDREEMPQFTSGGIGVNYVVRNGRIVFA